MRQSSLEIQVTEILQERGVIDKDARIGGITLGPRNSTPEELADAIESAIQEIKHGGGIDIDLDI